MRGIVQFIGFNYCEIPYEVGKRTSGRAVSIYKLFRRIILLSFIIFEITAQFYLIKIFTKNKEIMKNLINLKILFLKKILVYTLILVAVIILPFLPFNNLKILKHILEWNYFLGVIIFYILTFFMWKSSYK